MDSNRLQYPKDYFDALNHLGMSSSKVRHKMVDRLQTMGINDALVLEVLKMIPRHLFVDEGFLPLAYDETKALPIGYRQTLSQPLTVAKMTEWLFTDHQSAPVRKVLEIGTGSGYQTAILAMFAEQVYTLERISPLASQAQQRLHGLGLHNINFGAGDGHWGWAQHAPYDAIISAAAPEALPTELLSQLKIGGRLVIPIGLQQQRLTGFIRHEESLEEVFLGEASFVPMLTGIQPAG